MATSPLPAGAASKCRESSNVTRPGQEDGEGRGRAIRASDLSFRALETSSDAGFLASNLLKTMCFLMFSACFHTFHGHASFWPCSGAQCRRGGQQ